MYMYVKGAVDIQINAGYWICTCMIQSTCNSFNSYNNLNLLDSLYIWGENAKGLGFSFRIASQGIQRLPSLWDWMVALGWVVMTITPVYTFVVVLLLCNRWCSRLSRSLPKSLSVEREMYFCLFVMTKVRRTVAFTKCSAYRRRRRCRRWYRRHP